MSELTRLFQQAIWRTAQREGTPGKLGRADGTVKFTDDNGVTHKGRHWVRVNKEGVLTEIVAVNVTTPAYFNLPVRVADRFGVPTVIGLDDSGAGFKFTGGQWLLPTHAETHGRYGTDPLYISGLAFLPFAVAPTNPADMTVTVYQGWYRYQGAETVWETAASSSLSAYVPAANQHFIVLSLDRSTNTLTVTDGSDSGVVISASVPFTASDVESVVTTLGEADLPLAAIRLYAGQTKIVANDIFMDLRPWGGEFVGAGGLNIPGLTEELTPDPGADYMAIYDASEGAHNKVRLDRLTTASYTLFVQVADATVANTVTETSLLGTGRGTLTLDAGTLEVGSALRFTMRGQMSDTGTPTINIKLKLGSTVIASTGATALTGISDIEWMLDMMLTVRATGVSGTVVGGGLFDYDDGSELSLSSGSDITVDTTGALTIDVTMTWGTADASNTITTRSTIVELLQPPTSYVVPTSGDGLLLETGDFILLETSDYLLLE